MTAYGYFRLLYRLHRQHMSPSRAAWSAIKEATRPTPF